MMMEVGTARAEVGWMREHAAAAVLGAEQPEELRQRLQTDGYLLVRGLIRPDAVARARARIVATLREAGAIAESDNPAECRVAPPDQQEGRRSKQYRAGSTRRPYDPHALLQRPELRRVTDGPELHELFGMLFGEAPAMTGPQVFRPTPPGSFSGYHMDNVYMGRGSERLLTVWIPFMRVPVELGGLTVLQGSSSLPGFARMRATYGMHDVDNTRVKESGHFTDSGAELLGVDAGAKWVTAAEFRPGDVVVLAMRCLHGSIRNHTANTLRLSCDVRFQPRSDAFDERWHVPYRGHGRFRDGEWLSSVGGVDQPGGGMRRDEEKTMSLEEAKRDLWRLKPAL